VEDWLDRHVKFFSYQRGHLQRVFHALLAGTGVGIAGVDYNGLGSALSYPRDANFDGRGAHLISREHARDGCGDFGYDEREVALFAFVRAFASPEAFDVAKHAGSKETFRGDNGRRDFFEQSLHAIDTAKWS